jgi:hypothetical protein
MAGASPSRARAAAGHVERGEARVVAALTGY